MNWTRVSDSHLELTAALFFQTQEQELVTYILNLWTAIPPAFPHSRACSAKG